MSALRTPLAGRRLRLGMVGGGQGAFIGAIHRYAARLDDEYELVAAALSSDAGRSLESGLALRLEPHRIYTDFREMAQHEAARPDGIDVVSIVVPNHLHYAVAAAFLEAGIHVMCDKPLTTTLDDGLKLQQLAEQRSCLFGLTHNYSGYPLVRAARELVASGELGEIRIVQVEYAQDWLAQPVEELGNRQAVWRTDPALAGPAGCLGDIGSHAAHLAEFVTGMTPSEISAELSSMVPERRLDDHVQMQLRYSNGARGMLWASQVASGEENGLRLRVYGSRASLQWQQEAPNELWLRAQGEAARCLTRGTKGLPGAAVAATRLPPGHPEGFIEAFAQLYRDFAQDIRLYQSGGIVASRLVPGLDSGIRSLQLIEAALASHRSNGAWVALPPQKNQQETA
jgi:predicted dehydrogenase